jgi:hypothetical protein
MRTRSTVVLAGVVTLMSLPLHAGAQERIENARMQELQAVGDLQRQVLELSGARSGPSWIGYEVPLASGIGSICCHAGAACPLQAQQATFESKASSHAQPPSLRVLLRLDRGQVDEVRTYTSDCALDAGGQSVVWLRGVRPEDSVALLGQLVKPQAPEGTVTSAMMAIGSHAGKAADQELLRLVRTGSPEMRQNALMRLANARGRAGFEVLHGLVTQEESSALRRQALFAMARSHEPEAEQVLLQTAREDRDTAVRGQAVELYAARAGSRALPVLNEVIQNDPQPAMRSAAVLALRHLPVQEKREILNDLATRSSDPEVRHQARGMLNRMDGRHDGPPMARGLR